MEGWDRVSARQKILGRVKAALKDRQTTELPGPFQAWRPVAPAETPVDGFALLLQAAGGEVVRQPNIDAAAAWLTEFTTNFDTATVGKTVPGKLTPALKCSAPEIAPLGVSMARGAIAETGSLMMDARDGRRSQLLAPTHVVFVHARDVYATFHEALSNARDDLPSAIGLHSGPSKSADIGQVMVRGVHGPARLIAVVIGGD